MRLVVGNATAISRNEVRFFQVMTPGTVTESGDGAAFEREATTRKTTQARPQKKRQGPSC
jgi:hypothetical protein